jgi:glucose-1-phosphate cytidylyltransferase
VKTILLAGGLGTRLSEETTVKPKPMVTIGGRPILWHIMSIYAAHGCTEFVLALGYMGEVVKEYLINLPTLADNFTIDLSSGEIESLGGEGHPAWTVTALDTGSKTETGGRVLRAASSFEDETFMLTYGDGVADVDVTELLEFHRSHGKLVTVTAVRPPARFGRLHIEDGAVTKFGEKPQSEEGWINGGFFVVDRKALDYIDGDTTIWERDPLERIAAEGQLMAFPHEGFWQPMDTIRERGILEELWGSGNAPWKVW